MAQDGTAALYELRWLRVFVQGLCITRTCRAKPAVALCAGQTVPNCAVLRRRKVALASHPGYRPGARLPDVFDALDLPLVVAGNFDSEAVGAKVQWQSMFHSYAGIRGFSCAAQHSAPRWWRTGQRRTLHDDLRRRRPCNK